MKIEKVENLVANLYDEKECYTHMKIKRSIKSWIRIDKSAHSY